MSKMINVSEFEFTKQLDIDSELLWFSKLFMKYCIENNTDDKVSSRFEYYSGGLENILSCLRFRFGNRIQIQFTIDTLPEIDFFSQVARTDLSRIAFSGFESHYKSKYIMRKFLLKYSQLLSHYLLEKGIKEFETIINDISTFLEWE